MPRGSQPSCTKHIEIRIVPYRGHIRNRSFRGTSERLRRNPKDPPRQQSCAPGSATDPARNRRYTGLGPTQSGQKSGTDNRPSKNYICSRRNKGKIKQKKGSRTRRFGSSLYYAHRAPFPRIRHHQHSAGAALGRKRYVCVV